jgi:N-methylhydantoinase B
VFGGAISAARCAFKSLLVPEKPTDEWTFDPLEVVIPPGLLLSAENHAPMGFWNTAIPTVMDLILRAVGERMPDRVPAGHHSTGAGLWLVSPPESGKFWCYADGQPGGWGATATSDGYGPLKTLYHGDTRGLGIERVEARYPVRFRRSRLRREAAGGGLHRGGPGIERILELLEPARLTTNLDRTLDPPWGLAGGEPGLPGEFAVRCTDSDAWESAGATHGLPLHAGALVRVRTAGGGGWGAPTTEPTACLTG